MRLIKECPVLAVPRTKGENTLALSIVKQAADSRDVYKRQLAVSALLAAALREQGIQVDYHLPWGLPHAGDYDLPELFSWIDGICRD